MNIERLFLIALALLSQSMHGVIHQVTFMKELEGKKTLIFLHDMHYSVAHSVIKETFGSDNEKKWEEVMHEQNSILEKRIEELLSSQQSHANMTIITETNQIVLESIFNKSSVWLSKDYLYEALNIFPRLFIELAIPGDTLAQKGAFINDQRSKELTVEGIEFVFPFKAANGAAWIMGDRLRDWFHAEAYSQIGRTWPCLKKALQESPQNIPDDIKKITIEYAKRDLSIMKDFGDKIGFGLEKGVNVINSSINRALAAGLSESDHFASVYEYEQENIEDSRLHYNMHSLQSSVFDAELLYYIDNIDFINKEADQIVFFIGDMHARKLIYILSTENYRIDKQLTVENAQSTEEGLSTVLANAGIVNQFLKDTPIAFYRDLVHSDNH